MPQYGADVSNVGDPAVPEFSAGATGGFGGVCFYLVSKSPNFHLLSIMLAHEAFSKNDNPQKNCHKDDHYLPVSPSLTYVFATCVLFTFMGSGERRLRM